MSEIDATFKPFETKLDMQKTLRILKDTTTGADDGELFIEKNISEGLVFDDKKLRQSSFNINEGFGIRTVTGEKIGFSHSSKITEQSIKEASKTIRLATMDTASHKNLAPPPNKTNVKLYTDANPFQSIPLKLKMDLLRQIDDFARQYDSRVTQVSVSMSAY